MANRQFTVSARITADTSNAVRNTNALAKAEEELSKRLQNLQARYDAGEISAEKFLRGQAAIERQAGRLRKAVEDSGAGAASAQGALSRFADFLRARLVVTFGDVANAARAAFAAISEAAQAGSQSEVLRRQVGDLDAFLAKLNEVSEGTVAQADLVKSSVRAILLGIPADQISELLAIARASAIATGDSISKAFDDIVTGIGRASPAILDNLGIVVKLEEAYASAAEATGRTTDQLSSQEKVAAVLGNVLENNRQRVDQFTTAQSEAAKALQQGSAAMEDFRLGAGRVTAVLATALAGILVEVGRGFAFVAEAVAKVVAGFSELASRLPFVGERFAAIAQAARNFDDSIDATQASLANLSQRLQDSGNAAIRQLLGLEEARKGTVALAAAADAAGPSITSVGTAADGASSGVSALSESSLAAAEALGITRETAAGIAPTLRDAATQAIATAAAFDRLAVAGGRAAAVAAAVAGGGQLTLGGTRVRLPGGGSRLTRDPGLSTGFPVSTRSSGLG